MLAMRSPVPASLGAAFYPPASSPSGRYREVEMSSKGGPATIYLIRHGEKLGDPGNDKDGGPHLSVRGSARAAAIPLLFTPTSVVSGSQGGAPSCSLATHGVAFAGSYVEEKLASVGNPRFSPPHAIF